MPVLAFPVPEKQGRLQVKHTLVCADLQSWFLIMPVLAPRRLPVPDKATKQELDAFAVVFKFIVLSSNSCTTGVPALSKGSAVRYASCTPKWAGVPQAYRLLAGAQVRYVCCIHQS